ncbi:MAG: amino acid permease [Bacteroidales bacterium]|nr:amino acid permease [Bacteroidales bacterium]
MSQAKKFGAFAGVFTPSLLTILGVIMYMRLGWIVGNSGLYAILGIIIVAHIISFSTGLSISSIATDKKIKTGGIYYILSRSLGLPMGGAIGIALAIGTALSISLYIIGFAESFLSIPAISEFLHLPPETSSYTIVGTVIISLLVIIAFISTSLAIKTQYFILIAIFLSLISIVVGFYLHPEFYPSTPLLKTPESNIPIETLFAIFFPAVTGFTAGVAMSGDLKNPKKDIPLGTMTAIIGGFIVYIALAIGLAFFVDQDLLVNHADFLIQIAWIPSLIFLGIWGATLSSALGGILGGPRIFQAIAKDNILPKFLSVGYGENAEPRNALLLIFVIAEIGILIGELNVIAGIVSMFYLASYGFINMAFALESWASTDFSPSFKIPKFVGIIGFIASFAVMFRLDPGSMIIAFIIMWAIFFLLKRKELRLDFGDVWQSVWAGIIRKALHHLDQQEIEERNWRPNVLLFSGGTKKRKHLLELGKAIVGKHGLLSNFDLIENQKTKYLFTKHEQSIGTEGITEGVFTRRHSVKDIYNGIELLSATYGFSGVEPNTILLGWSRQSKNPIRLIGLLHRLNELDLNVLHVDYDKNRGFGKYKLIDIWWRDKSKHSNLALKLAKLIYNSPSWHHAHIRLQVVNSVNQNADLIRHNAQKIFEELRINAELRIINNEIEQKGFYDIIKIESANADLIFMGMPTLKEGEEMDFIEKTNQLLPEIGTTVLVSAASKFRELNIGVEDTEETPIIKEENSTLENKVIKWPKNKLLAREISSYADDLIGIEQQYVNSLIEANKPLNEYFNDIINLLRKQFTETIEFTKKSSGHIPFSFLFKKTQSNLNKILIRLEKIDDEILNNLAKNIELLNKNWLSDYQDILQEQSSTLNVIYNLSDAENILNNTDKRAELKFAKKVKRHVKLFGRPYNHNFKFANSLKKHHENDVYSSRLQLLNFSAKVYLKAWINIEHTAQTFNNKLLSLRFCELKLTGFSEELTNIQNEFFLKLNETQANLESLEIKFIDFANGKIYSDLQAYIDKITTFISKPQNINTREKKKLNKLKIRILHADNYWKRNQVLLMKNLKYSILFERIKNLHAKNELDLKNAIENQLIKKQTEIKVNSIKQLKELIKNNNFDKIEEIENNISDNFVLESEIYDFIRKQLENSTRRIRKETNRFPENDELINAENFNKFTEHLFVPIESIAIKSSALINYIIEEEYIEELHVKLKQFSDKLIFNFTKMNDTLRLIPYSFKGINAESKDNFEVFLQEQEKKLNELEIDSKNKLKDFSQFVTQLSTTINNQLSTYHFLSIAENYRQYVREQVSKKGWSKIKKKAKTIQYEFVVLLNKALYQRSNAILFAKKLNTINLSEKNKVSELLKLSKTFTIKPEVDEKIPFYYKQLFLNKNNFLNDFWVDRTKEQNALKEAIVNYKKGSTGGFLILGDYNSGKSFMAHYFASSIIKATNIYTIEAPIGGSTEMSVLDSKMSESIGIEGKAQNILQQLPTGSVVIFENIELWWERHSDGYTLIEKIHKWMAIYSKRIYIITTANPHSFEFMDKMLNINNNYLHVFQTPPVSAETLKNIIIKRHQASGLKYSIKGAKIFASIEIAQFFSQLFNVTQGIVGNAMLLWLSSIESIENRELSLIAPPKPNLQILDNLTNKEWALIIQFLLHRELTLKRIKNLFQNQTNIFEQLPFLIRSGILISIAPRIYKLNPLIYPFIKIKLFEKEIL